MMKIVTENIQPLIRQAAELFTGFDREFFERVWATDLDVYRQRVHALNFVGHNHVLDAGFGNGQWTVCLAERNVNVFGIEYAENKLGPVNHILSGLQVDNVVLSKGNTESLEFEDGFFDAIFCYGVIFLTDIRKTLAEFHRVLRKDGKLYFSANCLGWYLMCLVTEHNKSGSYDPRQMAADAIGHSFQYFNSGHFERGKQLVVSKELLRSLLSENGFTDVLIEPEGTLNFFDNRNLSFYKHTSYLGFDFILDAHCKKQ